MQAPLCKSSGNFLSIEIDSEITDKKLQAIALQIQQTATTFGKVRLIIFLEQYPSLNSAEELYDNLRFVKLYTDQIDKVAIIADSASKRTWVGLFSLFSGVKIEFFANNERQGALSWIQSP